MTQKSRRLDIKKAASLRLFKFNETETRYAALANSAVGCGTA